MTQMLGGRAWGGVFEQSWKVAAKFGTIDVRMSADAQAENARIEAGPHRALLLHFQLQASCNFLASEVQL
jgi:hypothetical protein